jgi:hypothetical protein
MRLILLSGLLALGVAFTGSTGAMAAPAAGGFSKIESSTSLVHKAAYCRTVRRCWWRHGRRFCEVRRRCW